MKKRVILAIAMLLLVLLVGCSSEDSDGTSGNSSDASSKKYDIGDEIILAGEKFYVYKVNGDELYLMAQTTLDAITFSDGEREQKYMHEYEGSLVEGQVNRFVDELQDAGIVINDSGIIDKEDLIELGFDVDGLNGTQYKLGDESVFIKHEDNFWVGGYCKYDTYAWAYQNSILTTQKCEDEYGVRPIIVINKSEAEKPIQKINTNLTIEEIVEVDCAWSSEGGIENPYDRFFFDCEKMVFTNIFESSEMSDTREFNMEFVDEKTIKVDGVMRGYEVPAEITIVNENKLRLRFVDDSYNDGDYYMNKVTE